MRSLHELYTILYDEIKDKYYIGGLCNEIKLLSNNIINDLEYNNLLQHFKSQKPNETLHAEFLKSETWCGTFFWWEKEENYNPINRKAFIKKMIEITKYKKQGGVKTPLKKINN